MVVVGVTRAEVDGRDEMRSEGTTPRHYSLVALSRPPTSTPLPIGRGGAPSVRLRTREVPPTQKRFNGECALGEGESAVLKIFRMPLSSTLHASFALSFSAFPSHCFPTAY
jgi:hypothetical protein